MYAANSTQSSKRESNCSEVQYVAAGGQPQVLRTCLNMVVGLRAVDFGISDESAGQGAIDEIETEVVGMDDIKRFFAQVRKEVQ